MSAPFKDATNDAVQFLTKHGDLTRAAAYDAIRLLTGNGFVVTQTDMLPSATDLSQAAVAAALEAAAAICADHMAVALQDEKDPEALKGYARGMYFAARQQGIEIRAQITQPQHDALAAHVAADVAKARVEDAAKITESRAYALALEEELRARTAKLERECKLTQAQVDRMIVNSTQMRSKFDTLLESAQALGAMPEGYCFCSKDRIGDDSKIHEPECRDLRASLPQIGAKP